jgi:hypothetical protein
LTISIPIETRVDVGRAFPRRRRRQPGAARSPHKLVDPPAIVMM